MTYKEFKEKVDALLNEKGVSKSEALLFINMYDDPDKATEYNGVSSVSVEQITKQNAEMFYASTIANGTNFDGVVLSVDMSSTYESATEDVDDAAADSLEVYGEDDGVIFCIKSVSLKELWVSNGGEDYEGYDHKPEWAEEEEEEFEKYWCIVAN